ncbi:phosphodiester glycosidase family protein [Actinomadura sp. DC4]|uniref:phosphodiester glycosidase family protein n=1 Tax=Actinomadura sp. DC4 TaxID=3055069 RepID=UPI0025B13718|nr:phosphodiester glycosidase family protein [Actinomadura sp. DC4]MDN3355099.1 phosphodiester glycosidase family protein [Actinomadura sp. DC4]
MLKRWTKTLSVLLAPVAACAVALPATAATAPTRTVKYLGTRHVWPGVVFRTYETTGPKGPVLGDLLDVDLRNPRVAVGLLHPPAVAARETVSAMADAQHAVAGVNGDFFNISETHAGVPATGSAVGPEVAGGRALKAAVPFGQRFGPMPPEGATTEDVIGVGADRTARISALHLTGTADGPGPRIEVGGLNQYALQVGGVGAFTSAWGPVSRLRSVCGTDTSRAAACSVNTEEVTVRRGTVTHAGTAIGAGAIPPDTTVLVGREAGADALRRLRPGDRVRIAYHLSGPGHLRFAVGGFGILRDGAAPPDLDAVTLAARTAAGVSRNGRHLYLVVADASSPASTGLTLAGLAALLREMGADDAMDLDGGGSTTLVLRGPGEPVASVRNFPPNGVERPVANGIGVFAQRGLTGK